MDQLFCDTAKLASHIGASLLKAAGLDEMICDRMRDYTSLMIKCATDKEWFASIRTKLQTSPQLCPLFDTRWWVEILELAFRQIVLDKPIGADIIVLGNNDD
jgi:predicted O-linked N-acetylglucosamine transferase (SPINDLY family)